jgi:hypothetical protein
MVVEQRQGPRLVVHARPEQQTLRVIGELHEPESFQVHECVAHLTNSAGASGVRHRWA